VAVATRASTVEDLLRTADDACYQAKQTGRARAVVADTAATAATAAADQRAAG
jgi:PleD family two-component response regulator